MDSEFTFIICDFSCEKCCLLEAFRFGIERKCGTLASHELS